MLRSPVLIVVLVLALIAGGVAWLLLEEVEPAHDEVSAWFERSLNEPDPETSPELAGRSPAQVPVGEWRSAGMETGGVSGHVVDGADQPLRGITVRLLPPLASEASSLSGQPAVRTSADGSFRFAGLAPGHVRVVIAHSGMVGVNREVPVPSTDLVLRLVEARVLEGVVRAADRSGVAEATVHLRLGVSGDWRRLSTVTDRDGRFSFAGISYAAHVGLAVDAGSRGRARAVDLPWRLGRPVDVEIDPPLDLVAVTARVVETMKDAPTRPVEAARLRWRVPPITWDDSEEWQEVKTNADGRAQVEAPLGARVAFEAAGLPRDLVPAQPSAWTTTARKNGDVGELRAVSPRAGRVVGVVGRVQTVGGDPIPGAAVGLAELAIVAETVQLRRVENVALRPWAAHEGGMRRTDDEGRFSLEVTVEPGRHLHVFVAAPGFLAAGRLLPEPPGDVLSTTFVLKPSAVLIGRVVDDEQNPVAGARIALHLQGNREEQVWQYWLVSRPAGNSGPDGSFRIEGLANDRYALTLHAPEGPLGANQEINIPSPETRARDLVLPRGGQLHGLVVDEDGTPVGNAQVSVRSRHGLPAHQVWTDASGRFAVRGVARGRNAVSAEAAGFVPWEGPDQLLPLTEPLRIVLDRGEEVRGTVVDALGQPVGGARVLVNAGGQDDGRDAQAVATCNGHGAFALSGVRRPARFLATAPGHAFREVSWDGLQGVPRLVALAPGVVAGRVLNAEGEPVRDAEVVLKPRVLGARLTQDALRTRTVKTSSDGRFRVEGLYAASFDLEAQAVGTQKTRQGPVALGEENLEIRLEASR